LKLLQEARDQETLRLNRLFLVKGAVGADELLAVRHTISR